MRIPLMLAVLGAVGGAAWYLNQATVLTARLQLGANGPDITDRVSWRVLELGGEPQGQDGISLQYVERFEPMPDTTNSFAIPPGADIQVSAEIEGNVEAFEALTAARGENLDVSLNAMAGLLDLSVMQNDDSRFFINLGDQTSTLIYPLPEDGNLQLLLAPGRYDIRWPDDRIDLAATDIEIESGEIHELALDVRFLEEIAINLASPVPWDDRMPRPVLTLRRPGTEGDFLSGRLFPDQAGMSGGSDIGFGEQELLVEFRPGGVSSTNVSYIFPFNVTQDTQLIEVPLLGTVLDISVAGYDTIEAERMTVTAIELDYRGEALAGADVGTDGTARILYTYPDWLEADDEMGVALRIDGQVAAIARVGAPGYGEVVSVSLTPGEGIDDCMGDYGIDYCPEPDD